MHAVTHELQLRRQHVQEALRLSNDSSPGPDGLPYGAWRALGELAVNVLHGAFQEMVSETGGERVRHHYADFNESLLFFLPKALESPTGGEAAAFPASGVRPLNVTNCDNRLFASAIRLVLEPAIEPLIISDQRGFLPGRSMIANLLDVDEAIAQVAAEGEAGLALF